MPGFLFCFLFLFPWSILRSVFILPTALVASKADVSNSFYIWKTESQKQLTSSLSPAQSLLHYLLHFGEGSTGTYLTRAVQPGCSVLFSEVSVHQLQPENTKCRIPEINNYGTLNCMTFISSMMECYHSTLCSLTSKSSWCAVYPSMCVTLSLVTQNVSLLILSALSLSQCLCLSSLYIWSSTIFQCLSHLSLFLIV